MTLIVGYLAGIAAGGLRRHVDNASVTCRNITACQNDGVVTVMSPPIPLLTRTRAAPQACSQNMHGLKQRANHRRIISRRPVHNCVPRRGLQQHHNTAVTKSCGRAVTYLSTMNTINNIITISWTIINNIVLNRTIIIVVVRRTSIRVK